MQAIWDNGPEISEAEILRVARENNLSKTIAALLLRKGISDPKEITEFLNPRLSQLSDPFSLPGTKQAVDKILEAIDAREKILIFGDYDADGITSTVLLFDVLQKYGAKVEKYIPDRQESGYGLTYEAAVHCRQTYDPALVITVDCGTTAVQEIAYLFQHKIETIVLDHHEPKTALPECLAIVNPKLAKTTSSHQYLCTVGIVFKIAHGLMKQRRLPAFDLKETLDLVMLGTVADVVPLVSENRVFVSKGLERLLSTSRPGLKTLVDRASLTQPVSTGDIGFKIIPPINATGRLGQAMEAVELLLSDNETDCVARVDRLELQNQQRKRLGEAIFSEAEALVAQEGGRIREPAIILGKQGWHPGVIGIVAAKLTQKYHRPSVVVAFDSDGKGKGSARSIPGIHLTQALQECTHYLTRHGGHEMAAGLSLHEDQFEAFKQHLSQYLQSKHTEQDFQKRLPIDAEIPLSEVCLNFLDQYEKLGPFGTGNPLPVFLCKKLTPTESPRLLKGLHFQITFTQAKSKAKAMWFNCPFKQLPKPPWDVAFHLTRNHYRGETSAQMLIQDLRSSQG